jgi:superfamily II DNA/RNA helicase
MRRRSLSAPSTQRGTVFRNSKFSGNQGRRPQRHGQYIDPAKFVNKAVTVIDEEIFTPENRFSDFGFSEGLQRNLEAKGYEVPTPIQDGAIPSALKGLDVIGLANTGTGKTAAFGLPMIERLKAGPKGQTALIMAPTRELAVQIDEEFRAYARGLGMYSALCVGGVSMPRQIQALNRHPQVVIGTPGRLKDLNNQGVLKLDRVAILVLDEADRMFDMGFIRDIHYLIDKTPAARQTLCFSATITPDIRKLIDEVMRDPITVSVRTSDTSQHVEQNVIEASNKEDKMRILEDLLRQPEFDKVLVFGQTKFSVQRLAERLTNNGLAAEAIHGNKSQPQRQRALKAFKENKVKVLVATDVAARGLDIPNVSHVINFDQPTTYEDYVHRIGRTGRAGNRGHALTFVGAS